MKAINRPSGFLAAILAVITVFFAAALYESGIISDELYLRLISATESGITKNETYDLEVHFIDVGQAECILIEAPESNVIIDAGNPGYEHRIENYLRTKGIHSIDLFITTHPHSDHIGSAAGILGKFPVKNVIMPEIPEEYLPTTSFYTAFLRALSAKGCEISYARTGEKFELGDGATLEILGPCGEFSDNLNNYSVASKLTYGETSFLFTGDMEEEAEKALLQSGADISCTVFSAGHHGSSTSNSAEFLKAAMPEYAAISCGYNNDYGHPHKEVLSLFREMGIEYYRTDINGDIVFGSDGENVFVSTKK